MSGQWLEAYRLAPGDPHSCEYCTQPVAYALYYPEGWQGERPKYLCEGCKEDLDMALRDLATKARELTEKEAGA